MAVEVRGTIEEEKELSKEEIDKLEKREMLKFAITLFSIIAIITATIIGLNIDRNYNNIPYLNDDDCGGCDEYYYND